MTNRKTIRRARLGTALAALAIGLGTVAGSVPATAQNRTYSPSSQTLLSIGEGQVVDLPRKIADVWVSNPDVADVRVNTARQMNLFGKKSGEATVIATDASGSVVYATNVRVSQNVTSVNEVLRAAMPETDIQVTTVGQVAVLNGTVLSPQDSAQAQAIVTAYLNPGKKEGDPLDIMPINRLKTATPLQVNLRVKIAEINRSLAKDIGVNLLGQSGDFSVSQGEGIFVPKFGEVPEPGKDATGQILRSVLGTTLGLRKSILGLDLITRINLAEADGLVTTLAEPNLTALSGETASFLAGGEFPIPISQSLGAVTIEYKQYGVGLAFTPIVLADGRISMRVRPEVSELSNEGSIKLNGFDVPAITTRRAETTVELGSGQSFMLAGLLRNAQTNNIDKAPFLGDLPILGALFRSTRYRRSETELVIIVTPYLVRPVSGQLALPTDGYRAPSDVQRVLEGQTFVGPSRGRRVVAPAPVAGGAAAASPGFKL